MKLSYFSRLNGKLHKLNYLAGLFPPKKITVRYGNHKVCELSKHEVLDLYKVWSGERRKVEDD